MNADSQIVSALRDVMLAKERFTKVWGEVGGGLPSEREKLGAVQEILKDTERRILEVLVRP